MNHHQRGARTAGAFLIVAIAIGLVGPPHIVFAGQGADKAHKPSGFVDENGNTLFVESSTTPEVYRAGPIPTSEATSDTMTTSGATSLFVVSVAATTLSPNLIPNPSFETADANDLPSGWHKGGYGTNTRALSYPTTPAEDGSRAATVAITSYVSGDAKWYFDHVPVTAGAMYQFSDYSFSNVSSEVDVELKMSDGTFKYIVLARPGPSSSYQRTEAPFTVPAGAVSLTVFHVINRVGTLTVDNYSLNRVTSSPSEDLVANGDFETMDASGLPANWKKGGWGTNMRSFSYPVAGVGGGRAAQVSITSYTSGDAKWYFAPIQLSSGFYTYSDAYQSNVPSIVVAQYHNADGSYSYSDLLRSPAASSLTRATVNFLVPSGVADVTVFRVIQAVGTLTIDNVSIVTDSGANNAFPDGAVTLTFDDGLLSQYQNAVPTLNQYGLKGTFYIISRELADYGFPDFMSKAQIQSMFQAGHQIGAHTRTHPDLTRLTAAQQQQEIDGSRQDLLAMNVGPMSSFAYPYGAYDSTTLQIVKDAGFTSARTTINGYATATSDHYQLPRKGVINTTTLSQIEDWINYAAANRVWLIIAIHGVDTSGTTYSMTPTLFNQMVDLIARKGIPVITIDQGMQYLP